MVTDLGESRVAKAKQYQVIIGASSTFRHRCGITAFALA
jgi:hypothetical protein